MKIFFDTTVLVAASAESHPHHIQALSAVRRVVTNKDTGFISTHSIAEVYAALTRMPVVPRLHPSDAARIITENILPHFELVPIVSQDYLQALTVVRDGGWSGAKIYDALLLCCADKCGAERVYTFNLSDFRSLAHSVLLSKICAP